MATSQASLRHGRPASPGGLDMLSVRTLPAPAASTSRRARPTPASTAAAPLTARRPGQTSRTEPEPRQAPGDQWRAMAARRSQSPDTGSGPSRDLALAVTA